MALDWLHKAYQTSINSIQTKKKFEKLRKINKNKNKNVDSYQKNKIK